VFKLLVTLGFFLLVAMTLFGLRQQQMEIHAQCARLYRDIENRKDTLRNQQLEISRATSAKALTLGLKNAGIDTGDALQMRDGRTGKPRSPAKTMPAIETDLIAPLRNGERN